MRFYTGIGSRRTPKDICEKMTKVASSLAKAKWILRSGGAEGADSAFEVGVNLSVTNIEDVVYKKAELKQIFLPWPNFNNKYSFYSSVCSNALQLAKKYHPAWNKLSQGAQKLHARNVYQVLGPDLNTLSKFVICWHDGTGGTTQACRIAQDYDIPIINMINEDWKSQLSEILQQNSTS